jgi:Ca2+:H+ antiporter
LEDETVLTTGVYIEALALEKARKDDVVQLDVNDIRKATEAAVKAGRSGRRRASQCHLWQRCRVHTGLLHTSRRKLSLVVNAQIIGSIIGNGLLGLGVAIIAGTFGQGHKTFQRESAGMLSSLLILSAIGLMVPALFDYTEKVLMGRTNPAGLDESLSLGVSLVLVAVYLLNLIYSIYTNRDEFNAAGAGPGMGEAVWSKRKSLAVLAVCISIVAMEAELISSSSLEVTAVQIGLTPIFLGVAVLAIVGNAAECASAVYFARKGSMDLVMSITVGSPYRWPSS